MDEFLEFLGKLAWPATVIFVVIFLRNELRGFVNKLSDSVSKAAEISITSKGLIISLQNKIAAVDTRVSTVSAAQQQTAATVAGPAQKTAEAAVPQRLTELANGYLHVEIADYRARVTRKNEIAEHMGAIVLAEHVSRDRLIAENNEGLTVALAAAAVARPEAEDLNRLLAVSSTTSLLHARYKLVLAIAVIINAGFVSKSDATRIESALNALDNSADEPLKKLVNGTRQLLAEALNGGIQIG